MFHREAGNYKTSYAADMALFPLPLNRWFIGLVLVALFLLPPLTFNDIYLTRFTFVAITIIAALGLNILLGLAGQISLGHGASMSVGAYAAANLAANLDLPFWLALPAGGLASALIGAIIGFPALRIKGMYIAIATLAGQKIVEWTLNHAPVISGGPESVIYLPPLELFGLPIDTTSKSYLLMLCLAIVFVIATLNIKRSRLGRAFVAIRDNETAAAFIGINVFKYKIYAFSLSSFYAGVAGVLFSYYIGVASFANFGLDVSISYLAIAIIGGLGSVFGTILGVAFFTVLPLGLGVFLGTFRGIFFELDSIPQAVYFLGKVMFGILIIGFLILEPAGLNQLWIRVKNYFRFWPFSH